MSNTHGALNFEKFRSLSPKQRGEAVATILSDYVNILGDDGSSFVETVLCDHRTLQQSIFNLFIKLVEEWSESSYDARNQFTCNMSTKIKELFEKEFGTGSMQAPLI